MSGGHAHADTGSESLAVYGQCGHSLNLTADFHAAQAADALGHVAGHARRAVVHRAIRRRGMQAVGEAVAGQAHGFAEILKLTIAVTGAGYALLIMIGKNHFHLQTLHVTHMFGEGVNSHAFFHGGVTGGDDARAQSVGHFRKAYAAGGGFVPERLKAAQRRDEDAVAAGHMQNGFPRFERIFLSVD